MQFRITRGLDISLGGVADGDEIRPVPLTPRVAVIARDFGYPRVSLAVAEGDRVAEGSTLFTDRRHPDIRFVAPAAGVVRRIERGPRRRLEAVVIETGGEEAVEFEPVETSGLPALSRQDVRERFLSSGLWTAFRARPYDRIPPPDVEPRAIFVTAIDTGPLAADPGVAIDRSPDAFRAGLIALSRLTDGPVYVCTPIGRAQTVPDLDGVEAAEFGGPHPAGLPGTHIHALDLAVGDTPDLWYVGCQDVIAAGRLLSTGRLNHERITAIGGPAAPEPGLVMARSGAELAALAGVNPRPELRLLSGSVLAGHSAPGYLGRYHSQVTVLPQSGRRGSSLGNAARMILRGLPAGDRMEGCDNHGWADAMLTLDAYEKVWPYRSPPAVLLRALLTGDDDTAAALGCRGLAEDDLSLLTYLSAGKHDYAGALRRVLHRLERAA